MAARGGLLGRGGLPYEKGFWSEGTQKRPQGFLFGETPLPPGVERTKGLSDYVFTFIWGYFAFEFGRVIFQSKVCSLFCTVLRLSVPSMRDFIDIRAYFTSVQDSTARGWARREAERRMEVAKVAGIPPPGMVNPEM